MSSVERIAIRTVSGLFRAGQGMPLVLLHGIGAQAESFRPAMEAMETTRPVFAWDMPGYGQSRAFSHETPAQQDYAQAVLAILDHFGWKQADLAGHSLGCVVAMAVAARTPARVHALLLASPALGYKAPADAPLPPAVAERVEALQALGAAGFAVQRSAKLVFQPEHNRAAFDAVKRAMAGVSNPGYAQASRLLAGADLLAEASAISCSVLILCGGEDVITPPANAQHLFDAFQSARPNGVQSLVMIPGCGHAMPLEKTAEFTAHCLSFGGNEPAEAILVPPVSRAITLLRYIGANKPLGNLSQAARAMGINRTTLSRLIQTLEAESFVERVGTAGEYTIGIGLIEIAANKLSSMDVVEAAGPVLARLCVETGLSAHLGILQGREVFYLLRHAPNVHLVSNVRVGSRLPAHATTMGRILLGYRNPGEVAALYGAAQLERFTPRTPTSLRELLTQIARDRDAGLAFSQSQFEAGIDSIAAPVFDHAGGAIAAVNVSGPEAAFKNRDAVAALVRAAAAEISRKMGGVAPPASTLALPRENAS